MNVNAFFSILAFREVRAFFFRMKEWALLISVITIGKVPTSHFLFIFMSLLALLHSLPDVVLMMAEVYHSVAI